MREIRQLILCIVGILVISINNALTSPLTKLMKYADSSSSFTSINKGGAFSDQQTGYLTGGSIMHRGAKPKILQPIMVQPPDFKFDACSGSFDARFGGFSYIKSDEFAKFFKSVATSSGSYVAKMAIKEVCPQCENIISDLEAVARDINGLSMNQCALAQNIAEGGLSMLNNARKQQCIMQSNLGNRSSDMHEANRDCVDNPNRNDDKAGDDELKSLLGDNFNLVWKALSQGADKKTENGLKELMMSVTGSVIGEKKDNVIEISTLPSLVEKEDLIERYIGKPGNGNSEVKLYVCNEHTHCLHPQEAITNISDKESIYGKVSDALTSLFKKIDANTGEPTDDEQALIEFSSIPLIGIMEMELATKNKGSAASFSGSPEFIEVICYDMVTNFMQKMLEQAKSAVEVLKTAQLDNTPIDRFMNNVTTAQGYLRDKRYMSMQKLLVITQVKQQLVQQQSVFELRFSRFFEGNGKG